MPALTIALASGASLVIPSDLAVYVCAVAKVLAVPVVADWLGLSGSDAGEVVDKIKVQCVGPPPAPPGTGLAAPGPLGLPWWVWGVGVGGVVLYLATRDR